MNLRDLEWAARKIVEAGGRLAPQVDTTANIVRKSAQGDADAGQRARDAMNMLVQHVLDSGVPGDATREQQVAWRVLNADSVFGSGASNRLIVQLSRAGLRLDQAGEQIAAYRKELEVVSEYSRQIQKRAAELLGPSLHHDTEVLLRFSESPRLDDLEKHASDLDTALRALAELAGASPESPAISNVETGSLILQVILDPGTWEVLANVLTVLGAGAAIFARLRQAVSTLRLERLDVAALEADLEKREAAMAKEAAAAAQEKATVEVGNELSSRVLHATTILTKMTLEGVEMQLLVSGDSSETEKLAASVNEQLRLLPALLAAQNRPQLPRHAPEGETPEGAA